VFLNASLSAAGRTPSTAPLLPSASGVVMFFSKESLTDSYSDRIGSRLALLIRHCLALLGKVLATRICGA